jgi:hypothetical protein
MSSYFRGKQNAIALDVAAKVISVSLFARIFFHIYNKYNECE